MNFFDIFDFNHDGHTDAMESALGFMLLSEEFDEERSDSEADEVDF